MMNLVNKAKKKSRRIEDAVAALDMEQVPKHIAIIMDGNGRWATKKKLPRVAGHKVGIDSVHHLVDLVSTRIPGIKVLTLYAFSTENWFRPAEEVNTLMKLLVEYLRKELAMMLKNNVHFQTIGRTEELPLIVQKEIAKAMERTKNNDGLILNIALNYSSKVEIVDAVRDIVADVQAGKLNPEKIDEALFNSYLYTSDLPDPDLLIRTSGEMRISNFLLWQLAYGEIWTTPVLWPDFRELNFIQALNAYRHRERRFGRVGKTDL